MDFRESLVVKRFGMYLEEKSVKSLKADNSALPKK